MQGSRKAVAAFVLCLTGCVPEGDLIEVPVEVPVADESYLILEEEGSPMPKKLTELAAASSVADADQLYLEQGGTSKRVTVGLVAPLPTNYIGGLITANGTDVDHDIDIAVGVARDSTDVENMRLTAAITKQIDAAWAVGTNQGGLDTGAVAGSTMYAIWLIKRSDTGIVDVLFSTSFTAPTMPTNYDRKRLIAAIKTIGSPDIARYTQSGDYFDYKGVQFDVTDSSITSLAWETATLLSVPPNCLADIVGGLENLTTTSPLDARLWFRRPGSGAPSTAEREWLEIRGDAATDTLVMRAPGRILVDGNSQIDYAAVEIAGSAEVHIRVRGFEMLTRRDP